MSADELLHYRDFHSPFYFDIEITTSYTYYEASIFQAFRIIECRHTLLGHIFRGHFCHAPLENSLYIDSHLFGFILIFSQTPKYFRYFLQRNCYHDDIHHIIPPFSQLVAFDTLPAFLFIANILYAISPSILRLCRFHINISLRCSLRNTLLA